MFTSALMAERIPFDTSPISVATIVINFTISDDTVMQTTIADVFSGAHKIHLRICHWLLLFSLINEATDKRT